LFGPSAVRYGDYGCGGAMGPQLENELKAVLIGHVEVCNDEVRPLVMPKTGGFRSVPCLENLVACSGQRDSKGLTILGSSSTTKIRRLVMG
jgi:hypothetical protein